MLSWNGSEDLEAQLASLIGEHDAAWDGLTDSGLHQSARKDPEAQYHWSAAEACETVLDDLRGDRFRYATLCPSTCGCRGNGDRL